ncbi:MAG: hypothetical protein JNM56_13555 [Planctomycetia bacterium]|nr:hypothetical protein [Planctomycetia bacterium]
MAGNNPRPPSPFHERGSFSAVQPQQKSEDTSRGMHEVPASAQDAWEATRQGAEQCASRAADVAGEAWDAVAGLVRRYPLAAIGVGVALGCLLACALPRGDSMTRRMSEYSA